MTELRRKSFLDPDDAVRLPLIEEDIVELGGYTVARVVQAPGWVWSRDMAPLVVAIARLGPDVREWIVDDAIEL